MKRKKPVWRSKRVIGTAVTLGAPGAIELLGQGQAVVSASRGFLNSISPGVADGGYGIALLLGLAFAAFVLFVAWTVLVDYAGGEE